MRLRILGEEVVVIQKIKCPNHKCGDTDFDIGITRFRIIVELEMSALRRSGTGVLETKGEEKYT